VNSSNSSLSIADCVIKNLRLSTNFIKSLYMDNIAIKIKNTLIKNISISTGFYDPHKLINFKRILLI
jgi:hypothetical protein